LTDQSAQQRHHHPERQCHDQLQAANYTPEPNVVDNATLYGLAGKSPASSRTESDPAALLLQYLTSFGNAVGRGPHYQIAMAFRQSVRVAGR
jgi:hypothetical protein